MPHPTPIDQLLSAYTELAQRPPKRLTPDRTRSLMFFTYEQALASGSGLTDPVPVRVSQWTTALHALEAFVAQNGRWPRENNRAKGSSITPDERRLATWVRSQRSAADLGRRCTYQLDRLACIPGYHERPLEDRWNTQFLAYQRFVIQHHRAPVLSSTSNTEKRLAAWAAKQRIAYRNRRLAARRISLLGQLPLWTWGK
ncbi:MAG: helicase associated domain-containing protein [Kineosporiaceae bacterium]|nr:helicase associated domain-containing protein [Aeromicrobium sp.]